MKQFYLQVDHDSIIRDAIEYQVDGYVPYQTNEVLPVGLIGGWYKLENGVIVEYPALKLPEPLNAKQAAEKISALENDNLTLLEALAEVYEMVLAMQL